MKSHFPHRHLLGIEGLRREDVELLLDTAESFFDVSRRPVKKVPTLRGKTILNVFYENSTRTRTSFELAGKRLSADVVNMSMSTSSVAKGESLYDTVKTLEAMRPDVVVIRHASSGAPHFVARHVSHCVVNAGDGMHEHPTQALLDAFTIRRKKGTLEGLVVTICGDIAHSRVARSNMLLLKLFGAEVRLAAPPTLLPKGVEAYGVRVFDRLEPALEGADVVMALRVQNERLMGGAFFPSAKEYSKTFGLSDRSLRPAKPDAIVMHPGPMNRGIEIEPSVADGKRSVVLDQVEAGVAVRMAVLYLLSADEAEAP
ncbi:MAG: aspartate carbamoyltransferase catalytic subunit [Myxococcales bacterium]|nr:aspartate carbamoyltransferase catalytic subunit [Myxococcales bacterium]